MFELILWNYDYFYIVAEFVKYGYNNTTFTLANKLSNMAM